MRIVVSLVLVLIIVVICAKINFVDVFAALLKGKPAGPIARPHGDLTGGHNKSPEKLNNKLDSISDILRHEKPSSRQFMNDFSNSIDKFNNEIHSDLLKLIADIVLDPVKLVNGFFLSAGYY